MMGNLGDAGMQGISNAMASSKAGSGTYQSGGLGYLGLNGLLGNLGTPYQSGMNGYGQYSQRAVQSLGVYRMPAARKPFAAMVLEDEQGVAHHKRVVAIDAEIARLREANDRRQRELVGLWFGPA